MLKNKRTKYDNIENEKERIIYLRNISQKWKLWLLAKMTWKKEIDLIEVLVDLQMKHAIQDNSLPENNEFSATQERCENSVSSLWERYKEFGIKLESTPTIELVDGWNRIIPNIVAFVKEELELHKEQIIVQWRNTWKKMMHKYYELELDESLFNEFREYSLKWISQKLDELVPEANRADIIFYTKYLSWFDEKQAKWFIGHEMFHLLEMQYWIRYEPAIIREWTATYVQNLFIWKKPLLLTESKDYNTMIYTNMAYHIHHFFEKAWEENPVSAILTWKYKTEIEALYAEEIHPLVESQSADLDHYYSSSKTMIQHNLLNDVNYKEFAENPTIENLLSAFDGSGLKQYSERLSTQPWKESVLQTYVDCLDDVKKYK